MSAKGQRFAKRVAARMHEKRCRTHDAVKAAGGPSSPIMTKILAGNAEEVSLNSLDKLEVALELRPGSAAESLANDADLVPAESVSATDQDGPLASVNTRKPEWMSDEQWRTILHENADHFRYLLDKAARERG